MQTQKTTEFSEQKIIEIAGRIREMREISGFSVVEMSEKTNTTVEQYTLYESGVVNFPFTFLHNCANALGMEISEVLAGQSATLSSYMMTRKDCGQTTTNKDGIMLQNLAPKFRDKIAEPYFVKYNYSEELQSRPINLTAHSGQEFDLILSGHLKVQIGDHIEILHEGDSIYYNSSTPHGMIAIDGMDCTFCAVVIPGEKSEEAVIRETIEVARSSKKAIGEKYVVCEENDSGYPESITYENDDNFNFAFDIVDVLGKSQPDKLAMLHIDKAGNERRFTFSDIMKESNRTANYFKSLGIRRGDKVMLVLKRHYQFWFAILALHKIGAIVIPATNLLQEHDFVYRFQSASVSAILCTSDGDTANQVDKAQLSCPTLKTKIIVGESKDGWNNFNQEYKLFSTHFEKDDKVAGGNDPMLMFFTSGTTGYPKITMHCFKYPLGHYATAKYWHRVNPDGLHLTISDTGWAKSLWGKLYGQWLCEAAIFVYDFDRFDANDILPMFKKYNITTFCAPPTMYRMMIKEDLSRFDLSSIQHATIAGEALNPEVFKQFEKATGIKVCEGFGQSETTLCIGNLVGMPLKIGSMGKPVPSYDVSLMTPDGEKAGVGERGEIVIKTSDRFPNGLFTEYYNDPAKTADSWYDGYYHTGDLAWYDEDGYYWYVGRIDDVIKSSGYRIGPFEIENVIMELPYVLECGVSAAPDEIRGQVVKASIVLVNGKEPTDELKKEIQTYVKTHTAPYKYPRIIEFRKDLPKTISGKIIRSKL